MINKIGPPHSRNQICLITSMFRYRNFRAHEVLLPKVKTVTKFDDHNLGLNITSVLTEIHRKKNLFLFKHWYLYARKSMNKMAYTVQLQVHDAYTYLGLACENSRPSSLPAGVAFRVNAKRHSGRERRWTAVFAGKFGLKF